MRQHRWRGRAYKGSGPRTVSDAACQGVWAPRRKDRVHRVCEEGLEKLAFAGFTGALESSRARLTPPPPPPDGFTPDDAVFIIAVAQVTGALFQARGSSLLPETIHDGNMIADAALKDWIRNEEQGGNR